MWGWSEISIVSKAPDTVSTIFSSVALDMSVPLLGPLFPVELGALAGSLSTNICTHNQEYKNTNITHSLQQQV